MSVSRRDFLRFSGLAAASTVAVHWMGAGAVSAQDAALAVDPALHVLKRLTWGVREEDIARITAMGIPAYIDWQLDYEAIPDPLVDAFIDGRRILSMSAQEINDVIEDRYEAILLTMLGARLYRAIYSERQLYELMVEFWTDHFNVPIADYIPVKIAEDRLVARQFALGKFRDLLLASAQSPAMLVYLDNAVSNADHPNENYARELLELHTLGVDGGYTEEDVVGVARILTGWTIRPGWGDGFFFDQNIHDDGEKTVLGQYFPAGRGIEEGLQLLDMLALHPSTARFISTKLCRRFVADQTPQSLIDSTTQVFIDSEGDLRAVMRHIFNSAEFMGAVGQKYRRPMDFVVAGLRILLPNLSIDNLTPFIELLEPMGHVPFFWHPPNGYPDASGAWMNTNGLLHRWNTAISLGLAGEGYFEGTGLNIDSLVPAAENAGALVDVTVKRLLHQTIASADRDVLIQFVTNGGNADTPINTEQRTFMLPSLVGLLLASPYFQWR